MNRGLIPACAGKTTKPSRPHAKTRAHPRVCGENVLATVQSTTLRGSSPRVRGKRRYESEHVLYRGLIPACAGKTRRAGEGLPFHGAHPRVCGENSVYVHYDDAGGGSSPRVRGKLGSAGKSMTNFGLIPACAGKTHSTCRAKLPCRAHPRVCGENSIAAVRVLTDTGSSPRVRGKPSDWLDEAACSRLIPACAGKTA